MQDIIDHYNDVREDLRLSQGWGLLELARTVYSAWLGSVGYEMHLIDPVPGHVEQARRSEAIRSAEIGDARQVPANDASVDGAAVPSH